MEQGTPEWLEFRRTRIGASDAPIIMGESPWCTPHQLWERKLGLTDEQEVTYAMQRGLDVEDEVRRLYHNEKEIQVEPAVLTHKEYPWMIASLDGINEAGTRIIEIKYPNAKDHAVAAEGKVPDKYYWQLQHQMAVAEVEYMDYVSYSPIDMHIVTIARCDDAVERMIAAEKAFYSNMMSMTEPELTDRDLVEVTDPEWQAVCQELKEIQQVKAREKQLRARLLELAQGRSCQGYGYKFTKSYSKGSIDYKAVPELQGVDLEPYRKSTIEKWRFS